jgi:hypothetical protein
MSNATPTQLRFPPFAGLIHRLSRAIDDRRHASYIDHSLGDLLTQRIFQIACGYADANDANTLRRDPMFNSAPNASRLRRSRIWPAHRPSRAWKMPLTPATSTAWPKPLWNSLLPATPNLRH